MERLFDIAKSYGPALVALGVGLVFCASAKAYAARCSRRVRKLLSRLHVIESEIRQEVSDIRYEVNRHKKLSNKRRR